MLCVEGDHRVYLDWAASESSGAFDSRRYPVSSHIPSLALHFTRKWSAPWRTFGHRTRGSELWGFSGKSTWYDPFVLWQLRVREMLDRLRRE